MRRRAFFLLGLSVSLLPFETYAQFRECGTTVTERQIAMMMEQIERLQIEAPHVTVDLPLYIPLAIHICRQGDGTGGFTLEQLAIAMTDLNQVFDQVGIKFFQYGDVIYIDSDHFFTIPNNQASRDELLQQNVVPNTINVYFTNLIGLCGQATFPVDPPPQGVLMNNTCAGIPTNPSTFAHEIGHFLALLHTHETAFGIECPNGSNCKTAGDRLCDTPADPNLENHVNSDCAYDNYASPPSGCGNTAYSPQTNNIMSYSRPACRNLFTANQILVMVLQLWDGPFVGSRAYLHTNVKYVDLNAGVVQNGKSLSPFKTVSQATDAANRGNLIVIRSGNYPEQVFTDKALRFVRWDKSGSVVIGQ